MNALERVCLLGGRHGYSAGRMHLSGCAYHPPPPPPPHAPGLLFRMRGCSAERMHCGGSYHLAGMDTVLRRLFFLGDPTSHVSRLKQTPGPAGESGATLGAVAVSMMLDLKARMRGMDQSKGLKNRWNFGGKLTSSARCKP